MLQSLLEIPQHLNVKKTRKGVEVEKFDISSEKVNSILKGPPRISSESLLPNREKITTALEEKLPVNHARVLVFGPEGSGKTCLVETLVGAVFHHTSPTNGADQMEISIQQTDDWELLSTDQKIKELEVQLKAEIFQSVNNVPSDTINTTSEPVPSSAAVTLPTQTATCPVPLEVDKIMEILEERKLYDHTRNYITIWDFAGQQVFHQTHGLFVSEEVVCVIVFNAAKSLDSIPVNRYPSDTLNTPKQSVIEEICYWMQLISVRVSKKSTCDGDSSCLLPTYILVGTHIDELHNDIQVASEIAYKKFAPIFREELSKMPFIDHVAGSKTDQLFEKSCSLFFVSNLKRDLKVIMSLKSTIIKAASIMKQTRPIKYVNLERKLLFLSHFDRTSVIEKKEIELIAKDCGISSKQEFSKVLGHFHQRGLLLHYSQIISLSDLVILSPHWLAKLLTYVITTLNCRPAGQPLYKFSEKLSREGLLEQRLLQWSIDQFVKKENAVNITYEQVVDLLLKFNLISDVTESSIAGRQTRTAQNRLFLVLHLLPVREPLHPTSDTYFKILYHFSNEFIPDNLVNELIVTCAKWSHQHSHKLKRLSYQCICISYGKNQTICLRSVHEKCVIELTIVLASNLSSEEVTEAYIENQKLIGSIKDFIDDLMKQYMPAVCNDLPVECYVPCPNCDSFCIPLDSLKQTSRFYCEPTNKYVNREDYHVMLTTQILLSPSKAAFAVSQESALKVLRVNFAMLETCLPVDDILGKLYTQNVITERQKEEILSLSGKPTQRSKLTEHVNCSVRMDQSNFGKFCSILKSIPAAKRLGEKLWKEALSIDQQQ